MSSLLEAIIPSHLRSLYSLCSKLSSLNQGHLRSSAVPLTVYPNTGCHGSLLVVLHATDLSSQQIILSSVTPPPVCLTIRLLPWELVTAFPYLFPYFPSALSFFFYSYQSVSAQCSSPSIPPGHRLLSAISHFWCSPLLSPFSLLPEKRQMERERKKVCFYIKVICLTFFSWRLYVLPASKSAINE